MIQTAIRRVILLVICLLLLAACGTKGPVRPVGSEPHKQSSCATCN